MPSKRDVACDQRRNGKAIGFIIDLEAKSSAKIDAPVDAQKEAQKEAEQRWQKADKRWARTEKGIRALLAIAELRNRGDHLAG